MLDIYLPIAEMAISLPLLLAVGGGIGFLSGLFGVSGGFLLTPILLFMGVPPPIAVGTQANQAVASACAGMLAHRRSRNVDIKLGFIMLAGSGFGTLVGTRLFGWLKEMGQIDFVIALLYVILLGAIGGIMIVESSRALLMQKKNPATRPPPRVVPQVFKEMPWQVHFPESNMTISVIVPVLLGFIIGITTVILGLGGSLLVPAMIYIFAMPAALVAGTSLFQVIFTSGVATAMHAINHHTVDIMLALPLMVGSVLGAQIGSRFNGRLRPELARWLLAVIILGVTLKLLVVLTIPPSMPYSIEVRE